MSSHKWERVFGNPCRRKCSICGQYELVVEVPFLRVIDNTIVTREIWEVQTEGDMTKHPKLSLQDRFRKLLLRKRKA